MIGVANPPPNWPKLLMVKLLPFISSRVRFVAGHVPTGPGARRQAPDALLLNLPQHRTRNQTFGVSTAKPILQYFLQDDRLPFLVHGGVEEGVVREGHAGRLDDEGEIGEVDAAASRPRFPYPQVPEFGDVHLLHAGDADGHLVGLEQVRAMARRRPGRMRSSGPVFRPRPSFFQHRQQVFP
jgi:hypothetical protein